MSEQNREIREGQQDPVAPPPQGFYTAFEMELSRRVSENEKALALLAPPGRRGSRPGATSRPS
ncbi:MAG: hypothetical protein LBG06_04480 [Deltaproteobacteria bacterium]|jgi:hypothetical protein|nr:hypothetical protein [Deltaproteobacteria bacterium]